MLSAATFSASGQGICLLAQCVTNQEEKENSPRQLQPIISVCSSRRWMMEKDAMCGE
jgi:hypothetical protein